MCVRVCVCTCVCVNGVEECSYSVQLTSRLPPRRNSLAYKVNTVFSPCTQTSYSMSSVYYAKMTNMFATAISMNQSSKIPIIVLNSH